MCDNGGAVDMIEASSDLHAHYRRDKDEHKETGDRRFYRRGVTTDTIERLKTRYQLIDRYRRSMLYSSSFDEIAGE
jgi:hypothetical protein